MRLESRILYIYALFDFTIYIIYNIYLIFVNLIVFNKVTEEDKLLLLSYKH